MSGRISKNLDNFTKFATVNGTLSILVARTPGGANLSFVALLLFGVAAALYFWGHLRPAAAMLN